jgi:hypothetical protein
MSSLLSSRDGNNSLLGTTGTPASDCRVMVDVPCPMRNFVSRCETNRHFDDIYFQLRELARDIDELPLLQITMEVSLSNVKLKVSEQTFVTRQCKFSLR